MSGFVHRGHYVHLIPEAEQDHWVARVIVEVHAKGQTERIYYRDHTRSFASREEAEAAAVDFGRQMVENFIVPASGEGDLPDAAPGSSGGTGA